jgi:hypothetical protein
MADMSHYSLPNVNTARRVPNAQKMTEEPVILGRELRNGVEKMRRRLLGTFPVAINLS